MSSPDPPLLDIVAVRAISPIGDGECLVASAVEHRMVGELTEAGFGDGVLDHSIGG
ncbi:MAG: hypothetical protein QNJ77_08865 [Acidimicrobiia bacterium]|nr:hypothetical protein [Acidimicrobiia bacterium]